MSCIPLVLELLCSAHPSTTVMSALMPSGPVRAGNTGCAPAITGISPPELYGGSTCVGLYAIQLAKRFSGYKIATVASPRNHELLRNYRADVVFDVNFRPCVVGTDISFYSTGTLI